jgi:predicted nucleic acid-binding protein
MTTDEFDEQLADQLLNDEEHAEVHHIQHHFDTIEDEKERAVLGWRATSIYVAAFKREIVRLRRIALSLESKHTAQNCRCGHADSFHDALVVCRNCRDGADRVVSLSGEVM